MVERQPSKTFKSKTHRTLESHKCFKGLFLQDYLETYDGSINRPESY